MGYIVDNVVVILLATLAGLAAGLGYAAVISPGRPSLQVAALAAVAEFWLACILAGALILAPDQAGPWTMALGSAVIIWIGFVAPTLLVTELYRGLPVGRALSDAAHWLAIMLIQSAAMQALGLSRPG